MMTNARLSNHDVAIAVGTNLREIRHALGWRQGQLAAKIDCVQGHVSAIERGKRSPSLECLFELARAFSVAPARLLRMPLTAAEAG
ncbi:helix-turn-helix transcriptional regulator [uncultured Thiodictyon sp.]|uniref:helix-turn-helix domain-containing protein n=1 Tax=uncultured Thiodictyon sp. TaxID=1846217 RepID=UPI0025FC409A|nr:helix-turn-helix transcriptional regulator [uncultured Thiodictyon sp.]